jgi:hypothetical protein
MDPAHGQPGLVPLPAGFDLHQMLGASTPGFENPAAGTEAPGGIPDAGSLGGLPIGEMPRGEMTSAQAAGSAEGDMPRGEMTSAQAAGSAEGDMPGGEMASAQTAGSTEGDMPGAPGGGMPPGGMEADVGAAPPDSRDGMPTGAMATAAEPGAAFDTAGDGPGADGMPAGAMIGESGTVAEPSPPDAAGGRAGEIALEGRWRLTLSSITG